MKKYKVCFGKRGIIQASRRV